MNSSVSTAAVEFAQHGPRWGSGPPPSAFPMGFVMCIIALLAAASLLFVLFRRFGPPWVHGGRTAAATAPSGAGPDSAGPENTARRLLAERFANGDISVEEFLERSSALNWYPGATPDEGA